MKPTDITDLIVASKKSLETKIVQLFAVVMTNYRAPLGDRAWDQMRKIAGAEQTGAIAFLSGFLMGEHGSKKPEEWARLLPPDTTKRWKSKPKKPPQLKPGEFR